MHRPSAGRRWRIVAVVMALVVGGAARGDVPIPQPKVVEGESCVEPVDQMRRDHMRMLMHQRDDTVLSGIRTAKHSLVGCIDCHVDKDSSGEFIAVNAPGQFCSTCHEYAAVELDCFQCHATTPSVREPAATGDAGDGDDRNELADGISGIERLPSMNIRTPTDD